MKILSTYLLEQMMTKEAIRMNNLFGRKRTNASRRIAGYKACLQYLSQSPSPDYFVKALKEVELKIKKDVGDKGVLQRQRLALRLILNQPPFMSEKMAEHLLGLPFVAKKNNKSWSYLDRYKKEVPYGTVKGLVERGYVQVSIVNGMTLFEEKTRINNNARLNNEFTRNRRAKGKESRDYLVDMLFIYHGLRLDTLIPKRSEGLYGKGKEYLTGANVLFLNKLSELANAPLVRIEKEAIQEDVWIDYQYKVFI